MDRVLWNLRRRKRIQAVGPAFVLFVLSPAIHAQIRPADYKPEGIEKILELTAKERSTILLSVADQLIGYAKNGRIEWIETNHNPRRGTCAWPHPALSHDGSRVAFVSDSDKPEHCRILIRDMESETQRQLIETGEDPGEISWSWDDSEMAFSDHGIYAASVKDGVRKLLLPYPVRNVGAREFTFWVWYPMQWLHNDKDLVAEFKTEMPTKEPGEYSQQLHLLLIRDGDARQIDIGSQPAVSPTSDRIAYYSTEGVVAIDLDKDQKATLSKAPRTALFFKDDMFWKIVWSPDGERLFFGTIVSENRRDDLYLLDVRSGHREKFLTHTSITIRGWQ